mgnify:CR=1 FL=1
MVRLLPWETFDIPIAIDRFNPTMVRLLPGLRKFHGALMRRFNPTMVRLLHTSACGEGFASAWFQSHNGAIAADSGG